MITARRVEALWKQTNPNPATFLVCAWQVELSSRVALILERFSQLSAKVNHRHSYRSSVKEKHLNCWLWLHFACWIFQQRLIAYFLWRISLQSQLPSPDTKPALEVLYGSKKLKPDTNLKRCRMINEQLVRSAILNVAPQPDIHKYSSAFYTTPQSAVRS